MQNYRLTLAYDGTRYRGWQRLPPPAKTVQASVETALGEIFGQPLEISGSGRTDAGVHAACQVASFHAPKRPTDEVLGQLRRLLPEDIGALTLDYAPERFHARLSAVEKTYVYRLWNSDRPDVFARRYRAWEPRQLDCGAMRAGAAGLVGIMITTILFAPGIIVYAMGQRERGEKMLPNMADKAIAAAPAVGTVHEPRLGKGGHDALQILLADALPLGHRPQGNIALLPVLRQVHHHPQRIAPLR